MAEASEVWEEVGRKLPRNYSTEVAIITLVAEGLGTSPRINATSRILARSGRDQSRSQRLHNEPARRRLSPSEARGTRAAG
jgi:hypothetical protein